MPRTKNLCPLCGMHAISALPCAEAVFYEVLQLERIAAGVRRRATEGLDFSVKHEEQQGEPGTG